MLLINL